MSATTGGNADQRAGAAQDGASPTVEQADAHCAAITRSAAANFYYGIRLLPEEKRTAMCAIYAFARRIDDIGDSGLPPQESLRRLDEQAKAVAALGNGARSCGVDTPPSATDTGAPAADARPPSADAPRLPADAVLISLAAAHRRFDLPLDALTGLIEGVRMDAQPTEYESFEDLVLYCRHVAGTVGRLSLAIFGSRDRERAEALADDLGVAMQLTNILRDIREDAQRGRVYLPAEDLRRYQLRDERALDAAGLLALAREAAHADERTVAGFDGQDVGQMFALMRFQALRAHEWFGRGLTLLPLLDRRSAACVSAMSGIYRRLLLRIEERPDAALAARASLPVQWKAWVAIGSMLAPHRPPRLHPAESVR